MADPSITCIIHAFPPNDKMYLVVFHGLVGHSGRTCFSKSSRFIAEHRILADFCQIFNVPNVPVVLLRVQKPEKIWASGTLLRVLLCWY